MPVPGRIDFSQSYRSSRTETWPEGVCRRRSHGAAHRAERSKWIWRGVVNRRGGRGLSMRMGEGEK